MASAGITKMDPYTPEQLSAATATIRRDERIGERDVLCGDLYTTSRVYIAAVRLLLDGRRGVTIDGSDFEGKLSPRSVTIEEDRGEIKLKYHLELQLACRTKRDGSFFSKLTDGYGDITALYTAIIFCARRSGFRGFSGGLSERDGKQFYVVSYDPPQS